MRISHFTGSVYSNARCESIEGKSLPKSIENCVSERRLNGLDRRLDFGKLSEPPDKCFVVRQIYIYV